MVRYGKGVETLNSIHFKHCLQSKIQEMAGKRTVLFLLTTFIILEFLFKAAETLFKSLFTGNGEGHMQNCGIQKHCQLDKVLQFKGERVQLD